MMIGWSGGAVTLAEAWSQADLLSLHEILHSDAGNVASTATLEHLRRLIPASQAAIVERDATSQRLTRVASSPPAISRDRILHAFDAPSHERMLAISLSSSAGAPDSEAWLIFVRDDRDFTEVDRMMIALLRPHLASAYRRASERRAGARQLTERQREVLHLVARGCRNDEIARHLVVSPGTVRKHLDNIYRQLGVSGRAAAVARAFPEGLTPYGLPSQRMAPRTR